MEHMFKYRIRVEPHGDGSIFIPQYCIGLLRNWENMNLCYSEFYALQEIAKFRKEQEEFEKRMDAIRERENKVRYIPVD